MLDFLHDKDDEVSQSQDEQSQENPQSVDVDAEDSDSEQQEQEYLSVSSRKKQAQKTSCILAGLFVAGLICLFFMTKKSVPEAASGANAALLASTETQIEAAITRLTGVKARMASQMEEILKKFYAFSDVQQVKTSELAKNPFGVDKLTGNSKPSTDLKENSGIDDKMQLLSIMATKSGNCCMVDDKILYEGDSIYGFTVKYIGSNFIKLESSGSWEGGEDRIDSKADRFEVILKLVEDDLKLN